MCRSLDMTENVSVMRGLMLFVAASAAVVSVGCAGRTLTITQDPRINNAMHSHRSEKQRTGDPLEVSIVCVTPKDLKREDEANERLRPGSGITSKEWYEHRPVPGVGDETRFRLPADGIYLLTNDKEVYGKVKHKALNGAIIDGTETIRVSGIRFPTWKMHGRNSVVYVFPKFIGQDGRVLPVPPAVYHPPGAYTRKLSCKIGVKPGGENEGQYIENTTSRRLHGSAKGK